MELKSVVYSHSDYFDVLDVFLRRWNLFRPSEAAPIILADTRFCDGEYIQYNNKDTYSKRLLSCLWSIKQDIIIFQHEDMFLYNYPDEAKLIDYAFYLKNSDLSFIRLCKTGSCELQQNYHFNTLFDIKDNSQDIFAIQPTIWKRLDLIKLLSLLDCHCSMWDLEFYGKKNCHKARIKGCLHYNGEDARGGHFDSNVWPYIATAIVKGKWNMLEYAKELNEISGIDFYKRGTI